MKLVKTTFFSAIVTFIRIISGFVAGKVVAIFTGPAGVALIGAFTNFITIALTFANGAINTGVIKYTSEYKEDQQKLKLLFSTAFKISIYCSAISGLLLLMTSVYLSRWIFMSDLYVGPIRVFGLTIVLYSLNSLLLSILNGQGQIRTYMVINTMGSIIGLIFTLALVFLYKVQGALYALVLTQSIVFFISATLVFKSPWFSWSYFNRGYDRVLAVKLSHYSLMTIVSALTVPVSQIVLRNMLIGKIGIDAAGYWQGMMRISDGYLMLITTSLATYYLPKLSSLGTDRELRKEIFNGYVIILPMVLVGCIVIYVLRLFIIKTLYTPDFLVMENLFFWQLLGDFLKMAAWILSYLMLAKAMTKMFIITEILFSVSYVIFGYFFIEQFNLKGITIAFSVNYFFYFLTMIFVFRKLIFNRERV